MQPNGNNGPESLQLVRVIAVYVNRNGLETYETLWSGYTDDLPGAAIPLPMTVPKDARFEIRLVGGLL